METVRGRRKNHRKHPEIKGKRPDKAEYRRAEAIERQAEYAKLTLEQKIAKLGPEPHSMKQRVRLTAQLEKQANKLS
jgi:hypothetical protein